MKPQTAYLLRIPDALYHKFRVRCLRDRVTVKDRLIYLVEKDLNNRRPVGKTRKRKEALNA